MRLESLITIAVRLMHRDKGRVRLQFTATILLKAETSFQLLLRHRSQFLLLLTHKLELVIFEAI